MYRLHYDLKEALDSPLNGVFGIFLIIWGVLYLESWKNKETEECWHQRQNRRQGHWYASYGLRPGCTGRQQQHAIGNEKGSRVRDDT